MAQNSQDDTGVKDAENQDDKLVQLDANRDNGANANSGPKDLNARLAGLELTLSELNVRLESTDETFRKLNDEAMERGGDITRELDEAHAKLKDLESSYQTLNEQSSQLSAESGDVAESLEKRGQELQEELERIQAELAARITDVNDEAIERHSKLSSEQSQLKRRATMLEKKSKSLSEDLDSRVAVMNTTVEAVEKRLTEQLQEQVKASEGRYESLQAQATAIIATATALKVDVDSMDAERQKQIQELDATFTERTDYLRHGLLEAEATLEAHGENILGHDGLIATQGEAIENHSAAIESLRAADSALSQRSAALEQVSDILNRRTEELQQSIVVLDTRIEVLEERSEEQDGQLGMLFATTREHFRYGTAAVLILLVLIGSLAIWQYNRAQSEMVVNQELAHEVAKTQDALAASEIRLESYREISDSDLAALRKENAALTRSTEQLSESLEAQDQLINAMNEKVVSVDDKAESANGRLAAMNPLDNFGDDNIIHGPNWISRQNPGHYVVRITTVENKAELYETATRWGHYLKQKLAWYPTKDGKFALVSGTYTERSKAQGAIYNMPAPDPWNRPKVEEVVKILKKI